MRFHVRRTVCDRAGNDVEFDLRVLEFDLEPRKSVFAEALEMALGMEKVCSERDGRRCRGGGDLAHAVISYVRDGDSFAERLADVIEAAGLKVWWDRRIGDSADRELEV